jgi:hypothetical protein
MPLKVYFCAPENIRGNIGEMAMRNRCLAMSFSESFMDYRSVVIELPLGNHTTTRWYSRYHSVVRTLPLGGTRLISRFSTSGYSNLENSLSLPGIGTILKFTEF